MMISSYANDPLKFSCSTTIPEAQVFKKPVILINYPKDIKAFYMKVNEDGKVGATSAAKAIAFLQRNRAGVD